MQIKQVWEYCFAKWTAIHEGQERMNLIEDKTESILLLGDLK